MGMRNTSTPEQTGSNLNGNASEAALELMKQLITLSSGVLALSATFIDKIGDSSVHLLTLLGLSWIVLLGSLFFGLQTISSIVKSRLSADNEWSKGYGQTSARVSKYGFVAGIALFAVFAFWSFASPKQQEGSKNTRCCQSCLGDSTVN